MAPAVRDPSSSASAHHVRTPPLPKLTADLVAVESARGELLRHRTTMAAPPLPPVMSIVMPCVMGGTMFALDAVDLGVDLSGNPQLLAAWYAAQPSLPLVSHWMRYCLPPLFLLLLLKLFAKSLPGAIARKPGAFAGCAPLLLLPLLIGSSVRATCILKAAEFKPGSEALATVTALHALRLVGRCLMVVSGVTEYAFGLRAAVAAFRLKVQKAA